MAQAQKFLYVHQDDLDNSGYPASEKELLQETETGDFSIDDGDTVLVYELKEKLTFKNQPSLVKKVSKK